MRYRRSSGSHGGVGGKGSSYRNSVRLSLFWEEYWQPEQKTLAEAVYAAGFGSYAQFYKVFTQAYGSGPRASLQERDRKDGKALAGEDQSRASATFSTTSKPNARTMRQLPAHGLERSETKASSLCLKRTARPRGRS